ncbi:MAG: Bug family tripartite tricarboxylate transporter substrate binding protein [Burkholderiales bacterium]
MHWLQIAALILLGVSSSFAQDFPTKPIRFIVPSTPGSSVDIVGRVMAPEMAKILGQAIVVENRPGGANLIGFDYVANQVPKDGYILAVASTNSLALLPLTVREIRFDPLKDLPPFVGVGESRLLFGSAPQLPWKNFNELIAYAKANPGKLNHGASAPISRLPTEIVLRSHSIEAVYINYPTVGPYVTALRTADVHVGIFSDAQYASLGDKFRILAVTGDRRYADLPDTPTFKELGYPQIGGQKFSIHAPVGVPQPVLAKLQAAASGALALPEVKAQLGRIGIEVANEGPDIAAKGFADIAKLYTSVAKEIGYKPD